MQSGFLNKKKLFGRSVMVAAVLSSTQADKPLHRPRGLTQMSLYIFCTQGLESERCRRVLFGVRGALGNQLITANCGASGITL